MTTIKFVIKSLLINQGDKCYYNGANQTWSLIQGATVYESYEEALKRIEKLEDGHYQIDKIFIND
jgi:hypothetical protein